MTQATTVKIKGVDHRRRTSFQGQLNLRGLTLDTGGGGLQEMNGGDQKLRQTFISKTPAFPVSKLTFGPGHSRKTTSLFKRDLTTKEMKKRDSSQSTTPTRNPPVKKKSSTISASSGIAKGQRRFTKANFMSKAKALS